MSTRILKSYHLMARVTDGKIFLKKSGSRMLQTHPHWIISTYLLPIPCIWLLEMLSIPVLRRQTSAASWVPATDLGIRVSQISHANDNLWFLIIYGLWSTHDSFCLPLLNSTKDFVASQKLRLCLYFLIEMKWTCLLPWFPKNSRM